MNSPPYLLAADAVAYYDDEISFEQLKSLVGAEEAADLRVLKRQLDEDFVDEVASYVDAHGRAATAVADRTGEMTVRSIALDTEFPLDDGENAAVRLANELAAVLPLCDEFDRLGHIHASLAEHGS